MREEEIKEQFREVIRYSQGIENPQVDELFENVKKIPFEKYIKKEDLESLCSIINTCSDIIEYNKGE